MAGFGSGSFGSGPFGSTSVASAPAALNPGLTLFRKRAGETQLRIAPANASVSDPSGIVGRITVVGGVDLAQDDSFVLDDLAGFAVTYVFDFNGSVVESDILRPIDAQGFQAVSGAVLADGDYFTIDDGRHAPVRFEFDNDASVTESPTLRRIIFTGAESVGAVATLMKTAINAAPELSAVADTLSDGRVWLEHTELRFGGGALNLTENVTDVAFEVVRGLRGTETVAEIVNLVVAAISFTPYGMRISAVSEGGAVIRLENLTPAAAGKGTASEDVAHPGFTIVLEPPDGTRVFCLGDDLLVPPVEDYQIGDVVRISQSISLDPGTTLVRLQARFRQPAGLPLRESLPVGTEVQRSERWRLVVVAAASLLDGETFVLNDGVNPAVTFEFDNDNSVALGNLPVDYLAETVEQMRDLLVETINAAPTLDIRASASGADGVALEHTAGGSILVSDTVAAPAFGAVNFPDIIRVRTPSNFFTSLHARRHVFLTGGTISSGIYRLDVIENPQMAVLSGPALPAPGSDVATTAYLLGAHWRATVLFEGVGVFEFQLGRNAPSRARDVLMPDLTINVSRFAGTRSIGYELQLAENTYEA